MAKDQTGFFREKKEWSEIKDTILECYLPQYFQKVLMTKRPIFYVDCFAGKGRFDDGKDGSPMIAMRAIHESTQKSKLDPALLNDAIHPYFIELNHADALKANLLTAPSFPGNYQVISGRFEDTICDILANRKGDNVFLYIDPYGIKALDSNLFAKILGYEFRSFEMLINFNSFGFFRDACQVMRVDLASDKAFEDLEDLVEYEPTVVDSSPKSVELLNAIAGGEYWKDIVRDYQNHKIDGFQAEMRLSTAYKEHLKTRHPYVLDMPIRLKKKNRPKYRMIHVSEHDHACFLMAQNMLNRKSYLFLNVQAKGQISMFDISPEMDSTVEGEVVTETEVEQKVRDYIKDCPTESRYTKFISGFYTRYGLICRMEMIQGILEQMQVSKSIEILRDPAFTEKTHKPTTFWEDNDSKDKKVTIRRLQS